MISFLANKLDKMLYIILMKRVTDMNRISVFSNNNNFTKQYVILNSY